MAFEGLKKAFTSAPILVHVDPQKSFIIEVDTSYFALGRSYIPWLSTRANWTRRNQLRDT